MIVLLFVLLFIVVPILELWLILQVGSMIGVMPTIALLLIDSLLGAWLVRSQGGAVWGRFRRAVDAGRIPADEVVDGFLVVLGGTLLIVPGFLSDLVGLCLVAPPTRRPLRRRVLGAVRRSTRISFAGARFSQPGAAEDPRVRDFAHSEQPRRRPPAAAAEHEPDFDFETHQLSE
jgi:UPF0716 protein FxsA